MDLSIISIVFIAVAILGVWALSSYLLLHQARLKSVKRLPLETSGVYSLVREDPGERLASLEAKPNKEHVQEWLSSQNIDDASQVSLVNSWLEQLEKNLNTIRIADRSGIETFSYELSDYNARVFEKKGRKIYITREMIHNHPELIPPFYPGDTSRLVPIEAWAGDFNRGLEVLLPQGGRYEIPSWRHLDEHNA